LPVWSREILCVPRNVGHQANAIVGGRGWAAFPDRLATTREHSRGSGGAAYAVSCRDYWVGPWGRGNNVNRRRKATRKSTVRVAKGGGKAARGRGRIALERCSVATYSRAISNICCWQPAVAAENNLRGCSPLAQSGKRLFLESTTTWHSKR
jgi:hypothetical protein